MFADLAKKAFREKDLDEYRRIGDTSCDFRTLALPYTGASIAPTAFGSPEIDPTGILIVYNGIVDTAPEEEVRFGGWFDDLLMVLVNGKVVFYTAWSDGKTRYKPRKIGKQRKDGNTQGDAYGDYIQIKKGDTIQIAIAEIPGGNIGGVLKVQMKGREYAIDTHKDPILHPFVVGELNSVREKALKDSDFKFNMDQIPVFKFAGGE